ncbi:hypothetical protein V6N13_004600 [Hibiscus sabdariffa]
MSAFLSHGFEGNHMPSLKEIADLPSYSHKIATIGISLVQEAFVKVDMLMLDVFKASLLGPISVSSNCLGNACFRPSVVSEFFKRSLVFRLKCHVNVETSQSNFTLEAGL